jgi:hypothetical protein
MKSLFYGVTIYNAIVFILLIAYFPIVWLNLVFTFSYLDSNDVPYYDNASSSYDRYNAMWWIIALDIMRVIGPAMASCTLGLLLLDKSGFISNILWYTVVFIVLLVFEIAKGVIFSWQWVYCSDYQLCRNFNPNGNASTANYVFVTMAISDWVFALLFAIYLGISSAMGKYARLQTATSIYNGMRDDEERISVMHVGIPMESARQSTMYRQYLSSIDAIPDPKKKKKKKSRNSN